MCRWAAYSGQPLFLSEILTAPSHSLICQSRAASECKTAINADGFGLAWYDKQPHPGLYRDVYPAWSDPNLLALAQQVQAHLFLAHVRASTGTATSRNNCHPFVQGRWSFMHNGQVGGFDTIRRRAEMHISDAFFAQRKGATDSEALFLTACSAGLDAGPKAAMEIAVQKFESLARTAHSGQGPLMRVAAAFSDGETLYAVRYASDDHAPSLYYQWNDPWQGWAVVSEPYEKNDGQWTAVPKGSFCAFSKDRVEITDFNPMKERKAA
ncbi:MAG: class II glutamine amidotransferase [Sulfitobacter sp.]